MPQNPAPAAKVFHRTVVTVEILGDQPFGGDIEDIADAVIDGDFSGMVLSTVHEETDGATMARLLAAQGSDPGFLGLDAEGNFDDANYDD